MGTRWRRFLAALTHSGPGYDLGDELTAEEARELVTSLGLELYEAQDALAFVAECCDIADREGRQPTTADVRAWLGGPQCARRAGLVFPEHATTPPSDKESTP